MRFSPTASPSMAKLYNAFSHMALLATASLLLLTSMAHAASTNTMDEQGVFLTRPYNPLDSSTGTVTVILEPPLPHQTHHTVHSNPPRGIFFTNTLATPLTPITVPLKPPMPRREATYSNAPMETTSLTTANTHGATMPNAAVVNATQTLTSTETLGPTTITVTLEATLFSSAIHNSTGVPTAHFASGEVPTTTFEQAVPGCTAVCGKFDDGGNCVHVTNCAGGEKKTQEAVQGGGSVRLEVLGVMLFAMLVTALWL